MVKRKSIRQQAKELDKFFKGNHFLFSKNKRDSAEKQADMFAVEGKIKFNKRGVKKFP